MKNILVKRGFYFRFQYNLDEGIGFYYKRNLNFVAHDKEFVIWAKQNCSQSLYSYFPSIYKYDDSIYYTYELLQPIQEMPELIQKLVRYQTTPIYQFKQYELEKFDPIVQEYLELALQYGKENKIVFRLDFNFENVMQTNSCQLIFNDCLYYRTS